MFTKGGEGEAHLNTPVLFAGCPGEVISKKNNTANKTIFLLKKHAKMLGGKKDRKLLEKNRTNSLASPKVIQGTGFR